MPCLKTYEDDRIYVTAYSEKEMPVYVPHNGDMKKAGGEWRRAEPVMEKGKPMKLYPGNNYASEYYPEAWIGAIQLPNDLSRRHNGADIIRAPYLHHQDGKANVGGIFAYTSTIKDSEFKMGNQTTLALAQSFYRVAQYYENLGRFAYILCYGDWGMAFAKTQLLTVPDGTIVLPGHVTPSIDLIRQYDYAGEAWVIFDGRGIVQDKLTEYVQDTYSLYPSDDQGIRRSNRWAGAVENIVNETLYESAAIDPFSDELKRGIDRRLREYRARGKQRLLNDIRSTSVSTSTGAHLVPDVAAMSEYLAVLRQLLDDHKWQYFADLPCFTNTLLDSQQEQLIKIITSGVTQGFNGLFEPGIRYPDDPPKFIVFPSFTGGRYPQIEVGPGVSYRYPFTGSGSTEPCMIIQEDGRSLSLVDIHSFQYRFIAGSKPPGQQPQIELIMKGVLREEEWDNVTLVYPNGQYKHYDLSEIDYIVSHEDIKCFYPGFPKNRYRTVGQAVHYKLCNAMLSCTADYPSGWYTQVPVTNLRGLT